MTFYAIIRGVHESMIKSTDKLFEMIETDPESFLNEIGSGGLESQKSLFTEYLYRVMSERKLSFKDLSSMTGISLSHIYQISSGQKGAGRDNAILMAIAMGLDLEQTQKLLKLSHNGMLYPRVKRDAIMICCIECGMTIEETDKKLIENAEKGLMQKYDL